MPADAPGRHRRRRPGHGSSSSTGSPRPGGRGTALAADLADDHEVVAVDAPGHGGSADVRADLVAGAALLGATGGRATYVGYSMGGRLCLHLAVARPDLVERLVLVSATAGIDDPIERAERRAADEALAASIERDGVDAFLARWVAQPLFAGLADPGLDDRRRNTVAGLASSLRLAGTGTQEPLWDRLRGADDAGPARRRRRRPQVRRRRRADGRCAPRRHPARSSPAPATPPTSSSRRRSLRRACAGWLSR